MTIVREWQFRERKRNLLHKYEVIVNSMPPPELRGNSRAHWAKKYKLSQEWKERGFADGKLLMGKRDFKPMEKMRITYVFFKKGRGDIGNFVSGMKYYEDGLVSAGVIPDDDSKYLIFGEHKIERVVGKDKKPYISVLIDEMKAE